MSRPIIDIWRNPYQRCGFVNVNVLIGEVDDHDRDLFFGPLHPRDVFVDGNPGVDTPVSSAPPRRPVRFRERGGASRLAAGYSRRVLGLDGHRQSKASRDHHPPEGIMSEPAIDKVDSVALYYVAL